MLISLIVDAKNASFELRYKTKSGAHVFVYRGLQMSNIKSDFIKQLYESGYDLSNVKVEII